MATAGTNITAIAKPAVGVTAGPTWATDLNTTIDAVDGHDHSTNKGVRITPAAINVNSAFEYNSNDITELKTLSFDTATASTTSYSIYQASGNLYWRNGSGTAVQITTGSTVNAGAGSIDGMTGTDAGATYVNGAKSFNFFCDSGNTDFGKMAHADLLLYKFSDDNTGDTDYITLAASALASGSSGTVTVPAETGTILTTATSFAGAINVATSSGNANIALKPHGTGFVLVGNGGATGKVSSNGAYDLILSTNSGTNSGSITITDAANGAITVAPNGSGVFTIGGAWTAASQTCANLGTVTTTGTIGLGGKLTAGSTEIEGSNFDINGGDISAATISGALTWTAAQDLNNTDFTNVDINSGTIDGTTVGASSESSGRFTTVDALTDFTIGGTVITNNTITDDGTLSIVATTAITLDADTALAAGHDLETSTTGKIKNKGAAFQSHITASLALGY